MIVTIIVMYCVLDLVSCLLFFIHCSEKWPDGAKKMASSGGAERFIHAKVRIVLSTFLSAFFPQGGKISVVCSILWFFS